ncbi:MAG: hypothetical protein LBG11_09405, partial [Bifidobacteriaceae bacterium]|nr:hypothetical protein [Bifidobacteriaceae bacterium]
MRGYLKRSRRKDAGITMVAVLASFTVLIVVILGSLAYLTASTKYSRYEQDNDLALAAAQSGLNDLLSRLRAQPNYLNATYVRENQDDPNGYCRSKATGGPLSEGDIYHNVCEDWEDDMEIVPWEYGPANGGKYQAFHYAVTNYEPIPMVSWVVSSGYSGSVIRSIRARISQDSTPMYLYMSDYEVVDPTDFTAYPNGESSKACGEGFPPAPDDLGYAWQIKDPALNKPQRYYLDASGFLQKCAEPTFELWDTLDGPVHSNDTIKSNGAHFTGGFTTADKDCERANPLDGATWDECVDGHADFGAVAPKYHGHQEIPLVPGKGNADVN